MEWSLILEILKWLIPVGGFGSVAAWFINRTDRQLKRTRDTHDAYKAMYEDVKRTLNEEIEEKRALRKALTKFEKVLSKIFGCRHYPNCPVNIELLHRQTGNAKPTRQTKGGNRQRDNPRESGADPDHHTTVESGAGDPDGEPP